MFNYAQQRAYEVLGNPCTAVLVTNGPAGIQVGEFPCVLMELNVLLLIPQTSDHLFNLEHESTVTLLIARCELKGRAQVVARSEVNETCVLVQDPAADWSVFVCIAIVQVQIPREGGWGNRETLDL